jgi:site-specific recombinase XerD
MEKKDTFGVHYVLRRMPSGKHHLYARIAVNGTICELAIKQTIAPSEWNIAKGIAKAKNDRLKQLNSYLEEVRAKLVRHYQQLRLGDTVLTAEMVKAAFLNTDKPEEQHSLLWLAAQHNTMMKEVLTYGTMKNYYTTERYLQAFLKQQYPTGDIPLKKLTYEFITGFEFFIRTQPLKNFDRCSNNGTMKHLERLKKIVKWGTENGWIEKNPFEPFKLKFKHKEREYLNSNDMAVLEQHSFDNPMLEQVKELFIFSCYTGLSYVDLIGLKAENIIAGDDGSRWVKTCRVKTDTPVYVPLLKPALAILEKYEQADLPGKRNGIFPNITNQEMNRSLKLITEICGIHKHLTFHLARHTFATTVTLMNGVPIESISKMLGHAKLSTTMIYARVTQSKIGMDMALLQNKMDANGQQAKLKVV